MTPVIPRVEEHDAFMDFGVLDQRLLLIPNLSLAFRHCLHIKNRLMII
jgi:hypothetical protein